MSRSGLPYHLTCDYQCCPLGIDRPHPVLDYSPACRQTAVRFCVFEKKTGRLVWDSGVRQTASTQVVPDLPLCDRTAYQWFVEAADEKGRWLRSDMAYFETGIFGHRFEASFIHGGSLYRREFQMEASVQKARVYFTALGYGELYINGQLVSDARLFPSYTRYDKRIEYAVYDVTALLCRGRNAVGVWAAPHWPVTADGKYAQMLGRYYNGEPTVFVQLEILDENGKIRIITSDRTFRTSASPITQVSIYDGECYDARLEQTQWATPGFDDTNWRFCLEYEGMIDRLCATALEPIREVETLAPVDIRIGSDGCLVDFGKNLAGVLQVRATGKPGDCMRLRHAELLREDGSLNRDPLRSARAEDTYIWAADKEIVYRPRFTYHGFRYAEISGVSPEQIREIRACRMRTAVRRTGLFSCSNGLLNAVHEAMVNSIQSNLYAIPTDCCQRDERQGWLGDGMAAAFGATFFFDMHTVYRKWLEDIADAALPDGNIATVVAPGDGGESFTWKAAYHTILRLLYQVYGDREAVVRHYPVYTAFLQYLETIESPAGLLTGEDFGDWLSLESVPSHLVRDAFYVDAYRAAVLFADVVGKPEDKARFEKKLDALRRAYHAAYYSLGGVQTGYYGANNEVGVLPGILARLFGIVPEEDRAAVDAGILHLLRYARGTPQLPTGIIGTTFVFLYLLEQREDELAYALMTRTEYPSFGFMIEKGATALWERWQWMTGYEMNSHNHSPLAGAGSFFYRVLGGLRAWAYDDAGRPCLQLEPYIPADLSWMDCRYQSPWGEVGLTWHRMGTRVHLQLQIPPNVEATIRLNGECATVQGPVWQLEWETA